MNLCSGSAFSNGYGAVGPKTRAAIAASCAIQHTTQPLPVISIPDSYIPPSGFVCTPRQPQTQFLACTAGQTGSITQTRTSSCPGPTWNAWQTTGNTCHVASCTTNYHQFTWGTPQISGGFRAPILLSNENLLAARTVINADEVFCAILAQPRSWHTWIQVGEMAKLNDTNDLAMGHLSNLRTETFYTRCGITITSAIMGCVNQGKSSAKRFPH